MEESISVGRQTPSTAIPEGDTVSETRDEILTLDDVAAYLKAGKRTVYRLAQTGAEGRNSGFQAWRHQALSPLRAGSLDRRQYQQEAGGGVSADQASRHITLGEEQGKDCWRASSRN
jgi:hypothetical protein